MPAVCGVTKPSKCSKCSTLSKKKGWKALWKAFFSRRKVFQLLKKPKWKAFGRLLEHFWKAFIDKWNTLNTFQLKYRYN